MRITRSKQYGAQSHPIKSATSPTAKPLCGILKDTSELTEIEQ
jgi:hypothetical protein